MSTLAIKGRMLEWNQKSASRWGLFTPLETLAFRYVWENQHPPQVSVFSSFITSRFLV